MTTHVMIDLETLGTNHDAVIWSLGAAKFNPFGGGVIETFEVTFDIADNVRYGRKIDPATMLWWMSPERQQARDYLLGEPAQELDPGLFGFAQWFGDESLPVWGNGATFDNVILRDAYKSVGLPCPWKYTDDRCYRTFKQLAPFVEKGPPSKPIKGGVRHTALYDAVVQAEHMRQITYHLNLETT